MKIYWTLKSTPELAEMSKKDRKRVWRRCYLKVFRNWQTWFALAACGGCAVLGMGLGQIFGEFIGDFTTAIIWARIGGVIGGGIGGFFFGQVATAMTRPYIREYLKSHDQERHK